MTRARRSMQIIVALFVAGLFLVATPPVYSQADAGPFVPVGHWSAAAVDRIHALGLAPPGTVRGQRSRTVSEVRAVLEAGAGRSMIERGYLTRFNAEFGAGDSGRAALTHLSAATGIGMIDGIVDHGVYTTWGEENWTGVQPVDDRTTAAGSGALLARLNDRFAAGVAFSGGPLTTRLDEAYATARLGPVGFWGGRRIQGFGPGTGAVALGGGPPIDGGGVHLTEPIRLPWLLRHFGPIRVDVTVAVLEENGPVARPYYIMTRGSIEPHSRVGFGVTRGGMIGAVDGRRSVQDVLYFLIGGQTGGSEYDNQVVSAEAWFRPATGDLPLLLYVEWGAEDSAGSWWDVPGIVAGFEVAAVPALPWLSVVVERTHFERSNSGNPPWYRHPIGFHDGWSTRGELLAHPLGGHGHETAVRTRASLLDGRVLLMTSGFLRRRGAENVYAPERVGRSIGLLAEGDILLRRGIAVQFAGATEDGAAWRTTTLTGTLRIHLPHGPR